MLLSLPEVDAPGTKPGVPVYLDFGEINLWHMFVLLNIDFGWFY